MKLDGAAKARRFPNREEPAKKSMRSHDKGHHSLRAEIRMSEEQKARKLEKMDCANDGVPMTGPQTAAEEDDDDDDDEEITRARLCQTAPILKQFL
ncbi:unnamed protein product [Angiostrongylus costaricensis]|uniref:Uncharacterized protein n=1 Tax=Angiostrongylus costaricensis TaxID=334426 RepID=A0A0R3PZ35_ANGCS|nr:unnamed protein product [Angiostrongylus costaricensis]